MLERKFHQRAQFALPAIALRPYIYTREEIGRLMAAARNLFSPHKLRCHTYYHLIGLLATTGMRSGEAVRLANSDVDLAEGLITIRESKFGKSRVVPLHSTTVKSLAAIRLVGMHFSISRGSEVLYQRESQANQQSP